MPSSEQNPEGCDARDDDSSTGDDFIKHNFYATGSLFFYPDKSFLWMLPGVEH